MKAVEFILIIIFFYLNTIHLTLTLFDLIDFYKGFIGFLCEIYLTLFKFNHVSCGWTLGYN